MRVRSFLCQKEKHKSYSRSQEQSDPKQSATEWAQSPVTNSGENRETRKWQWQCMFLLRQLRTTKREDSACKYNMCFFGWRVPSASCWMRIRTTFMAGEGPEVCFYYIWCLGWVRKLFLFLWTFFLSTDADSLILSHCKATPAVLGKI